MAIDPNWDINPKLPKDLKDALEILINFTEKDFKIIANSSGKTKAYILLKDNKKFCNEKNFREMVSYILGVIDGYNLEDHKNEIVKQVEKVRDKTKLPWE